jgi:hypothetical protein
MKSRMANRRRLPLKPKIRRNKMRKGELHSAESRAKISASRIGKQFTEEHKEAIRRALAGRSKSPSHRKAIAEGVRSARLARQQVSITTQPTEEASNQKEKPITNASDQRMYMTQNPLLNQKLRKRILRVHVHRVDKEVDPDDFIRAVDTYADWKIKAYLREQKGNEVPQVSARAEVEEDW